MGYSDKLAAFKSMVREVEYYKNTMESLIYWDKITYMPPKGIEYRSQVLSFMAQKQYQIMTSEEFNSYLAYFENNKENDIVMDAMVRRLKESSKPVQLIPEKAYSEYISLVAVAEQIWEENRESGNYKAMEPYFYKLVENFKLFTKYWGYEDEPYDALLNFYVEGLNSKAVDKWVDEIKPVLLELIEKRKTSQPDYKACKDLPLKNVPHEKQAQIWRVILEELGFDFDRGRVDIGAQSSIMSNCPDDVRVVNYYSDDDICEGILNVLHSGGRGIYEQNIDKALMGTLLAEVPSFAMEEAVGRFYENIVGKSKAFWQRVFPRATEVLPELKEIGLDNFYNYINRTEVTPIRISADELTYLVHVIIRYELERDLINGNLKFENLREEWNKKYQEYLGITPKSDAEGIMQDTHWFSGYLGYFPTNIMANICATQFYAAIEKEHGDISELIEKDGMNKINGWLIDNIYRWGCLYDSEDLIIKACGQTLDPKCYIDYLRKKF